MASSHQVITPQMMDRIRGRIGKEWVPTEPFFNTEATRDTIRHFCDGIGDVNPLFRDDAYATKTRFGCIVAPPCFLYSVYWPTGRAGSLPGIHGWHAGNDWTWYLPVKVGDRITYTVTLVDISEKQSEMAGKTVITTDETVYKNQRGEVVAKARGWGVRAERQAAGDKKKYAGRPRAEYTPQQLKKIQSDIDNEVIRGATPRYWEDVVVGEDMVPVVKGPLSLRDIFAFIMGGGSPYIKAHRIFLDYQRRHPAIGMIDKKTGVVDTPELVHMEETRAQEVGVPSAYDYGPQRASWLGNLLTNWAGDDGDIRKFHMELRLFNTVGDTTWCKGKVVKKYAENGEHLVECKIWAENQLGQVTAPGSAVVALPSRTAKAQAQSGKPGAGR